MFTYLFTSYFIYGIANRFYVYAGILLKHRNFRIESLTEIKYFVLKAVNTSQK